MIRILIVDDHEHIRHLVRLLVEAEEGWVVCGEAADGQQAIDQCEVLAPHLVILDVRMPVQNGFDTSHEIHRRFPQVLVLMLTTDESSHFALAAATCGAKGFLTKARAADHLVAAVSTLLRGETYFPTAEAN